MKIQFESELMKNHKHATIMKPGGQFQVFQTPDGDSLLFSIGTDGVFYLTREVRGDLTGWNMVNLSEPLKKDHGKDIKAKSFEVSQSPVDGTIQIALVVNVDKAEWLYVSLNNSNSDFSWAANVPWHQIPFDAGGPAVAIRDTYIRQSKEGTYVAADVLSEDADTLYSVNRYHIDLDKRSGKYWNKPRPILNLEKGSSSLLGRRKSDSEDGTYTFGFSDKKPKLDFALLSDDSEPVQLQLPGDPFAPTFATAIATAPNADGTTQLFVAAGDTLYRYPADQQIPMIEPTQIMQSKFLSGVTTMYGVGDGKTTAVWALNNKNEVVYISCPTGREGDANAWSAPLPILTKVTAISSFLNNQEGNHVLFAQTGDSLFRLSQDPVTTHWHHRQIVLPATDPNDLIEVDSFTTHIEITDDYNLPPAAMPTVSLSSSSPVSVYVDNVYHVLSHKTPLQIIPDATGSVTIVQETSSLGAVCYHLEVDSEAVDINPMNRVFGTVSQVKSSDDLDNMKGSDDGTPLKNVLPAGIDKNAAVTALAQLCKINVPGDGSVKPTSASSQKSSSSGGKDGGNKVEHAAGDVFRHIKHAAETVDHYAVEVADDVAHFVVKIGDDVYKVALTCAAHVAHAFEFVFQKIAVAFDKLVKYVGFLFNWDDIVRTHKVLETLLYRYVEYCVNGLDTAKQDLQDFFNGFEDEIKSWEGAPEITTKAGSSTGSVKTHPAQRSPQSHWGTHQLKNNMGNATSDYDDPTAGQIDQKKSDDFDALIHGADETIQTAIKDLKSKVIDQIESLTVTQIISETKTILLDALLETAKQGIIDVVDILKALVEGLLSVLKAPLKVPVLSSLYEDAAKEPLSILGLACLVTAIPMTVICKTALEKAPFADDDNTRQLVEAPSFADFQSKASVMNFQLVENTAATSNNQNPQSNNQNDGYGFDLWALLTNLAGAFGAVQVLLWTAAKKAAPNSKKAWTCGFASYLIYVMPNSASLLKGDPQTKWVKTNEAITLISVVKTFADIWLYKCDPAIPIPKGWCFASPIFESLINIAWLVPACASISEDQKALDIIEFIGNVFFDVGGIITPGTLIPDPDWKAAFEVTITVFTVAYGLSCAAVVALEIEKAIAAKAAKDHKSAQAK